MRRNVRSILNRRRFLQHAALFSGLVFISLSKEAISLNPSVPVEYIVVGFGAGGGPLAVNLAKKRGIGRFNRGGWRW